MTARKSYLDFSGKENILGTLQFNGPFRSSASIEEDTDMYLREGYFEAVGPNMADDIGQGYLTVTSRADEISQEILEAAEQYPELLDEFKADPLLLAELDQEPGSETFRLYRNDEIAFDGLSDVGYMGYGLDIAFSESRSFALVAYTGPSLPTIIRRYDCRSAEDAVRLWVDDWAAPLIITKLGDNDNDLDASREFR